MYRDWPTAAFEKIISAKRGVCMTKRERENLEQLAEQAEVTMVTDYEKKDLKEKRSVVKQMLYDGSKKLKHRIPKGIKPS